MEKKDQNQEKLFFSSHKDLKILTDEPNYQRFWYNPDKNLDVSGKVKKKILFQCMICFIFIIIEVIGAYLSHSIAILTDAAHLLSDLLGFFVSLLGIVIAQKINREKKTFGYIKVEVIGAFFSLLIIWVLTIWVFYKALYRMKQIINNETIHLDSRIMIGMAVGSLLMNLIMMCNLNSEDEEEKLHRSKMITSSEAEEGDEEKDNLLQDQKQSETQKMNLSISSINQSQNLSQITSNDNQNIKAAQVHILGDLVQSLGVIIISVTIYIEPSWIFLDPVISIIFIILSISFSIKPAKEIFDLLTDSVPEGLKISDLYKRLHKIENVKSIHDMHVWNLAEGKPIFTCHIKANKDLERVLQEATIECRRLGIYHTTIQIEQQNPKFYLNCDHNVHPQLIQLIIAVSQFSKLDLLLPQYSKPQIY